MEAIFKIGDKIYNKEIDTYGIIMEVNSTLGRYTITWYNDVNFTYDFLTSTYTFTWVDIYVTRYSTKITNWKKRLGRWN